MLLKLFRARAALRIRPPAVAAFSTTRFMASKKKIIICCDGTWQSSVSAQLNVPSNVTRLARRFACSGTDEDGETYNQVVFYDSGVGTGDIGFESVIQGGTGTGLDTNVIEAYNFIVLNYNEGDKIYCFGFSRGAYTARCVAGLVTDIGIVKPRDMNEFPTLYKLYQENNQGDEFRNTIHYHNWVQGVPADRTDPSLPKGLFTQEEVYEAVRNGKWLIRPHGFIKQETRFVEVVGVFDTVGSLGVPDIRGIDMSRFNTSYGFHNVKLSPFIKNAYHAMALDERRGPFSPTLWYIPYGRKEQQNKAEVEIEKEESEKNYDIAVQAERAALIKLKEQKEEPNSLSPELIKLRENKLEPFRKYMETMDITALKGSKQLLYQVWFPGVHINVGGGSSALLHHKRGDLEQMANITFCWMAEMLRPHLAFDASADTVFWEERDDAIQRARRTKNYGTGAQYYLRSALEFLHISEAPKYEISEATERGWATGEIVDSYGGLMTIAGAVNRTPGQCVDTNKDTHGIRQPLVKLGHTREFIHPCVAYRMKTLHDYKPPALQDFENKMVPDANGRTVWQWVKKTDGLKWNKHGKTDAEKWVQGPVIIPEWWIYPTKGSGEKDKDVAKSFERLCMPPGEDPHQPKGWLHTTRDAIYKDSDEWQEALAKHVDLE